MGGNGSGGRTKRGSNEKFTTDTDTDQESLPATFRGSLEANLLNSSLKNADRIARGAKKIKRVQFEDGKCLDCPL